MTVTLYKNKSDPRALNKSLTFIKSVSALLKEDCSILKPVFILDGVTLCNYIYIPDFGRYYFITDTEILAGKQMQITCEVDTLNSFKYEIEQVEGLVSRSQNLFNLYMTDPEVPIPTRRFQTVQTFTQGEISSDGLTENDYVYRIEMAGG